LDLISLDWVIKMSCVLSAVSTDVSGVGTFRPSDGYEVGGLSNGRLNGSRVPLRVLAWCIALLALLLLAVELPRVFFLLLVGRDDATYVAWCNGLLPLFGVAVAACLALIVKELS
jgi:hypothetical protein